MISSLNAIDSFDELQKAKEVMKRREAAAEKLRQSMAKKQKPNSTAHKHCEASRTFPKSASDAKTVKSKPYAKRASVPKGK